MKKPSGRDAGIAVAPASAELPATLKLDNASVSDIAQALASGQVNATALTRGYLARIEAYDGDGPKLNARCRAVPGSGGAAIVARAGYPSVMVPCGFVAGVDGKDTPDPPLGVTFAGRAWSEHKLLRLAYAYEQASDMRRPPPGLRALEFNLLSSRACRRARVLRRGCLLSGRIRAHGCVPGMSPCGPGAELRAELD